MRGGGDLEPEIASLPFLNQPSRFRTERTGIKVRLDLVMLFWMECSTDGELFFAAAKYSLRQPGSLL